MIGRPATPCFPVTAVVPVKSLGQAKSRLALPTEHRQALALAFALDTVAALTGSPWVAGVLVVTTDPVVAQFIRRPRVEVVAEDAVGLGAAVAAGVRAAVARRPGAGVAVVPADQPCLRPDVVTRVITLTATRTQPGQGAFVPDRSGVGTTWVIHPPGLTPVSAFGPGSAARHRALGLHPLHHAPAGARHDVDTLDDLADAVTLGAGPATIGASAALGLQPDEWAS